MKGGNFLWLVFFGAGLLLLGGGGIVGSAAPFKTDVLAVLVVEETDTRTPELDAIEGAIQQAVTAAKGDYRRLDKDQSDLSKDSPWVQEAWKAKGPSVPWVIGANARTGVSQPLTADSIKALSPLGVGK